MWNENALFCEIVIPADTSHVISLNRRITSCLERKMILIGLFRDVKNQLVLHQVFYTC